MVRLRLLGAPELRGEGTSDLRAVLTQPRLLALLAYLALARPRGFHRRDSLVALFWPELSHEQARNALRQAVHRLRRALGEGVLVNRGMDELGLDAQRLWCDTGAFEEAFTAGDLPAALDAYRGDLLPGFFVTGAPDFDRWLDSERTHLRHRAADAAWRLAERETAAGHTTIAAHWGRWATGLTPDDEGPLRRLMELLVRAGDRASAVRAYETFARRLEEDLDMAPSAETQSFVASLRERPRPSPAAPSPTAPGRIAPDRAGSMPEEVPPSVGRSSRWQRTVVPVSAIALLGIIVAAVWYARRPDVALPPAETLAVFPFSVRGASDLAYLREGMVDLLSAKLEGVPELRAIDPHAVIAAVNAATDQAAPSSGADVARIARRLGARWYINGDVVVIAGRLQLNSALYDVASPTHAVTTASVEGEATDLFELVDNLTGRLLAGRTPGRDTSLTRLAGVTTRSLPALKAFLEGEQAFRAGSDARAGAAFRAAVAQDSQFALAQYRLAVTATWATIPGVDNATDLATTAARNANRLTPLARDLLRAYVVYREGRADEAERLYRLLTDGHPDNVEAWLMLGETLFHWNALRGRSPEEARRPFARVLTLAPGNPHAMIHLARLAAWGGRTGELDSLARRYLSLHRDVERALEVRALRAYTLGDSSEMAAVARGAEQVNEYAIVSLVQGALTYADNLAAAWDLAALYTARAQTPVVVALGRYLFTDIPLAGGRWEPPPDPPAPRDPAWSLETRALIAAEPLFQIGRPSVSALRDSILHRHPYLALPAPTAAKASAGLGEQMRLYLVGLLDVRLGDTVSARRLIQQLDEYRNASGTGVHGEWASALRAEIARSNGRLSEALEAIERVSYSDANPIVWQVAHWGMRERFVRAELLHALRRDAEALQWYASLAGAYDFVFAAPSHLRQGQIYERLGNRERATFHYTRFLRLWSGSDASLRPLVSQAESALVRLGAPADEGGR